MNVLGFLRDAARASLALGAPILACACDRPARAPVDPGPPEPTIEYVARQEILTDLPMRVRLPARYGADRVLVFVHLWGTRGWRTIELARDGQTWEGAISCRAVSTVTGDTQYYFLALDAHGQPIIGSGSPDWPHIATIVRSLPEGAQGLPDHAPPATCFDPADCPAGLQGCPAYEALRPSCHDDSACAAAGGRCAWDGYCDGVEPSEIEARDTDELLTKAVRSVNGGAMTAKAARAGELDVHEATVRH